MSADDEPIEVQIIDSPNPPGRFEIKRAVCRLINQRFPAGANVVSIVRTPSGFAAEFTWRTGSADQQGEPQGRRTCMHFSDKEVARLIEATRAAEGDDRDTIYAEGAED